MAIVQVNSYLLKGANLESSLLARKALEAASSIQASDILLLDIRPVASFADYLLIMTAQNIRQMDSLAEEIAGSLKKDGVSLHHLEGTTDSGWLLLDYIDLVVHVFSSEQRTYYGLEDLWSTAISVVRIQ